ncbi:lipocalin family protein [Marilutibacter spongiae]|uniref:Outer membrane lipoprotein Blc n=1 Tax=Marilutibacter spongiae TaxID=2025720 RepID=A0A7W3TMT3_9GAMM|nr:lipocalin family protein [Lysobacter spongiae]MBB1061222.1 lipocalin family protein [Lysobacter spongiae]
MRTSLLALGLVPALLVAPVRAADPLPNVPVETLDLQRYSGQWHEIAHLPMFFQNQCVGDVTATYTPREDGLIGVRNACRTDDGSMDVAEGTARPAGDAQGQLEVRFAPDWLSWLPMVWGDYWVLETGPDYEWAVVGSPGKDYLWILSRTPTMDRERFEALRERAAQRGYPVDELVMMSQVD